MALERKKVANMCGFTAILGFNSDGNEVKFRLMIKRGKTLSRRGTPP